MVGSNLGGSDTVINLMSAVLLLYLVKLTVCFPSPAGENYGNPWEWGKRHVVSVPSYIAVCLYWAVYWLGMVQPEGLAPRLQNPRIWEVFRSTLLAFWKRRLDKSQV